MKEEIKRKFYDITVLIQQEFDWNLAIYGDKIQCRRGCSKCCSQIFRITKLDGEIIRDHIKSLPAEQREALQNKASEYITLLNHPGSSSHPSLKKEGSFYRIISIYRGP